MDADELRQFAEEAMLSASQPEEISETLMDPAKVWALAAVQSERAEAAAETVH